jgi:NADH-ubiquinone oxidoreductase chain 1
MTILFNIIDIILLIVPILLGVAFMTIIERRILAAMQRRVGPNIVGVFGVLQPFADALKLVIKETIIPAQATKSLFYLAPV